LSSQNYIFSLPRIRPCCCITIDTAACLAVDASLCRQCEVGGFVYKASLRQKPLTSIVLCDEFPFDQSSQCVPESNGAAPVAPTRASPAPPAGPTSGERSTPVANGPGPAPQTIASKDPKIAAQAAGDLKNIVRRKLTGYVGFANLPNQWHRKSVRKGFNFNVMVVGAYIPSSSHLDIL
jgi:hypothetical protein